MVDGSDNELRFIKYKTINYTPIYLIKITIPLLREFALRFDNVIRKIIIPLREFALRSDNVIPKIKYKTNRYKQQLLN